MIKAKQIRYNVELHLYENLRWSKIKIDNTDIYLTKELNKY